MNWEDSERCALCGVWDDTDTATIYDESGGAIVELCSDCREQIEADLCVVCRTSADPSRADGIELSEDAPDGPVYTICDDCRLELINGQSAEPISPGGSS